MPDKFPEAFDRFEDEVYVRNLRSFQELISSFAWWSGRRWKGTSAQLEAIKDEGEKLGFDTSLPFWVKKSDYGRFYARGYGRGASAVYEKRETLRRETVMVKGKPQTRYRDLKTGRFNKKPNNTT